MEQEPTVSIAQFAGSVLLALADELASAGATSDDPTRRPVMALHLIKKVAEETGYTVKALQRKIEVGILVEGVHYHRSPDGRIAIDTEEFENWRLGQPTRCAVDDQACVRAKVDVADDTINGSSSEAIQHAALDAVDLRDDTVDASPGEAPHYAALDAYTSAYPQRVRDLAEVIAAARAGEGGLLADPGDARSAVFDECISLYAQCHSIDDAELRRAIDQWDAIPNLD